MDKTICLTHYVETDENISREVLNQLCYNYKDEFSYFEHNENILLSNYIGANLLHKATNNDNTVVEEISPKDIEKASDIFYESMSGVMEYLNKIEVKYKVKFGIVSYYN